MYAFVLKLTGVSIIIAVPVFGYYLYCFDKKRISDPNYRSNVEKNRNEKKQKKHDQLMHRMLIFPKSNDMKNIKLFIVQEIEKGEQCMENRNYDKAVEHFANGLSLVDDNGKLFNTLRDKLPLKIYCEIKKQMQEIQKMLPITY